MTTTQPSSETTPDSGGGPESSDPRTGLAAALTAAAKTFGAATSSEPALLAGPTPCPEFNVEQLMEHMLFVNRRIAVIGNGGHFTETPPEPAGDDWEAEFIAGVEAITAAWADPAKLAQTYEVPWGEVPGVALMLTYTAEFAAHTSDLAQAIGADVEIDDRALAGAAQAVRFIPAEGRDDPAIPFGPVVEAPTGATNLEQILTWTGRRLDWSPPESV